MFVHPADQATHTIDARRLLRSNGVPNLRPSWLRVLLLASVSLDIDKKFAGDRNRNPTSKIFSDQKEGEIDSSGRSGRAVKPPILHYNCALLYLQSRKAIRQIDCTFPVS